MTNSVLPIVGVSACLYKADTPKPYHAVDDKYLRAVAVSSNTMPVIIPALGNLLDIPKLVSKLDGIMLTGSASNVHPDRYNTQPSPEAEPYDPMRDQTTFALINEALKQEVPLLAICRGFQELNVALGGSLHPQVSKIPGRMDHSSPDTKDMDIDYGPNHTISIAQNGCLFSILKSNEAKVNSLHYQAINQLGNGLVADAIAKDGTVEAISMPEQNSFVLGVQWHPEYKAADNNVSKDIFKAFGNAVSHRVK
ncbi:gamma-glutamyl-gamma-aminobutyrate hydrolase family protein [Kiloniella sp. EL199]|uniref:gamma-glutamyl-gamma-aminobutyrate hydrolase family protein n=1 Tax=Kiloniella sp. EL199 TaxID=2107581 RepID=UPI000EA2137E|nr:gamma-glutamyl-gamma-aminobutyrate hydrolase family protein [Kiloniella sp. EL199]